ncbi:hypothetical protein HMPREF9430_00945 [Solobacterium moorei F0204]|uniref:Uncharacterized protein n=1 Tax=Solobacterium moorei F0204 TaxID=706433 RepID=E7MN27_9FIRM|nr:hypothetical protein HMPREF9430_00945 [Solobacterium moorei F0204]
MIMGQMNLLLFSIFDNPFTTEYTKRCVSFLRKNRKPIQNNI